MLQRGMSQTLGCSMLPPVVEIASFLQALAKATVEEDWNKLPAQTQEMYVKMAEGGVFTGSCLATARP